MPSTVSVPSPDLARWLGTERGWIDQLAQSGELVCEQAGSSLWVDPGSLEDWLRRRRGDVGSRDDAGLSMLTSVGALLGNGGAAGPVAQDVVDQVSQRFGAAFAAIFLSPLSSPASGGPPGDGASATGDQAALGLVASSRPESQGDGRPAATELCAELARWVYGTGRTITLSDPRRAGLPGGNADGARDAPHDLLAAPVRAGSRVLGALTLLRRIDQPPFGTGDRSLAEIVCGQLGLALERSRYEGLLGRRLEEANLVYRQLEAYARDVRETYAAEKRRAEDLARALGELERTYLATVRGLAAAVEAKDEYTGGHLVRVTSYGLMIMEQLAPELAQEPQFEYGFLLHDVGKLGVPDAVLKKPGPLDDDEWELMRRHPTTGRRILDGIPFLTEAKEIVYAHHERWDGKGYPKGLRGEEVVLGGRVFPIADTFDAMTSDRPYRKALPFDRAIEEIARGSGTQFWPDAVEAFLSIPREKLEVAARTRPDGWEGGA